VTAPDANSHRRYDAVKRAVDASLAAAGLVATAPLQALIALLVVRDLGRPVLFRQCRPGLHARPFTLVKFRTMRDVDVATGLVSDADRLTSFGSLLRGLSLDELPTLWNVLVGDMSLVGPRPLLPQYLPRYSPEQRRRHEVRPGVTGLAQACGRNDLDWPTRLALDVEYVERRSLALDARILLRTVALVLRRQGISAAGHPTMPEFAGTAPQDAHP
jgi:lipopolysaccharide/colanic/teichoic acid biosynthesis glycosyltransferase